RVATPEIERKGAKVRLSTTQGCRDSREMGRESRYALYDLFFEKPAPLVPRYLRREVEERIDSEGAVLKPLSEADVRMAAQELLNDGVEAIGVCFLHSYRNGAHEQRANAILAEVCAAIPATSSSEVAPEIREYERGNTACANA